MCTHTTTSSKHQLISIIESRVSASLCRQRPMDTRHWTPTDLMKPWSWHPPLTTSFPPKFNSSKSRVSITRKMKKIASNLWVASTQSMMTTNNIMCPNFRAPRAPTLGSYSITYPEDMRLRVSVICIRPHRNTWPPLARSTTSSSSTDIARPRRRRSMIPSTRSINLIKSTTPYPGATR